jgi:hypothetical protein
MVQTIKTTRRPIAGYVVSEVDSSNENENGFPRVPRFLTIVPPIGTVGA